MKLLLFILNFLVISYSIAQTGNVLRLDSAINIALRNSLDIAIAKNNVGYNEALNSYGVAGGLPVVSGTASDRESVTSINQKYSDPSRNAKRNNAGSNSLNGSLGSSILLYNGMRVVATKKRLDELQSQSDEYLNSQIQNVIASVMTAYYDVVRQQYYLITINQSVDAANQQLEVVKVQQKAGFANNANLFQAQVTLNNLVQTQQTQQLVINQAKTELQRLLTFKADSSFEIRDSIIVNPDVLLSDVLESRSKNSDIQAAAYQVKINEQIVKETQALRYPSVFFEAGYNYARNKNAAGFSLLNESYGPTAALTLSVPIYNGNSYKRQQKAAEINVETGRLQQQVLERDYTSSAIKNFEAYQNNIQQLSTAKQTVEIGRQLLDLVLLRARLRQAVILDVNEAQQSFQNASFVLINLSFAAKAAEIELKRLSNTLTF